MLVQFKLPSWIYDDPDSELFKNKYDDFSRNWFKNVGTPIAISAMINCFNVTLKCFIIFPKLIVAIFIK